MITPDNELPPDDSHEFDADDQQSQQDIHSDGLDENLPVDGPISADILQQSYDASEPAYTLHLDKGKTDEGKKE